MILCLDVGNTHIYAGVFVDAQMILKFRLGVRAQTSDELGVLLKSVLRENNLDPMSITGIAMCSVVPDLDYTIRAACVKYFKVEAFVIATGVKTGLNIKYANPQEIGSDRISNAIAAITKYPNQDVIIIDFGTAITFCAISSSKVYLGGTILPGINLAMTALSEKTAKLPTVEVIRPERCLGQSTVKSIQAGLYYSCLGGCRLIIEKLSDECFKGISPTVLGTGGFSTLFSKDDLFDVWEPDLVLFGLYQALLLNKPI
jgi:type III pantothenate kinase